MAGASIHTTGGDTRTARSTEIGGTVQLPGDLRRETPSEQPRWLSGFRRPVPPRDRDPFQTGSREPVSRVVRDDVDRAV